VDHRRHKEPEFADFARIGDEELDALCTAWAAGGVVRTFFCRQRRLNRYIHWVAYGSANPASLVKGNPRFQSIKTVAGWVLGFCSF
jgi:hypothetical protein